MENLVNQIISIDKNADDRLTKADDESKKLLSNSEKEVNELKEELNAKAELRIKQVAQFHKEETDEILSRIENDRALKIQQLDEAYTAKHKAIEDSIFNKIVGGNID